MDEAEHLRILLTSKTSECRFLRKEVKKLTEALLGLSVQDDMCVALEDVISKPELSDIRDQIVNWLLEDIEIKDPGC